MRFFCQTCPYEYRLKAKVCPRRAHTESLARAAHGPPPHVDQIEGGVQLVLRRTEKESRAGEQALSQPTLAADLAA